MIKKNWYEKSYKALIIIPGIILLLSIIYLFNFRIAHGDLILKDVSLTGGTIITVLDEKTNINNLKEVLQSKFDDVSIRKLSEFRTGKQRGFFVEVNTDPETLKKSLEEYLGYKLNQENSSVEFSGEVLSSGFYEQLRFSIILAFIFMALVVFIVFRTFIPSLAVVFSAFSDIVMTITAIDLIGMKVSVAGIIAFLMLIGYSVDTDILLTSRLLKRREGKINEKIYEAFKTGMTMTLTSIAVMGVSFLIVKGISDVLRQIFIILLIGLGFDLINTWFVNAGILKWYVEKKESEK